MHCRESNPKTQTVTQPLRVQSQSNHVNDYLMVVFIFESIVVTKIGKNFAYLSAVWKLIDSCVWQSLMLLDT